MPEGPTVLVVDDEAIILNVVTIILRRAGFRVLAANSAGEALELVRSSGAPIYLAVLDLDMPKVSGLNLLARLQEADSGMRALLMSGHTAPTGMPEGCDFLTKPFTVAQLLHAVGDAGQRAIGHRA